MKKIVLLLLASLLLSGCFTQSEQWDEIVYSSLVEKAKHEKEFNQLMDSVKGNPQLILDQGFILKVMVAHDNAVIAGDAILETLPPPGREAEYRMLSEAFRGHERGGNLLIEAMMTLDSKKVTEALKMLEEYNAQMNAFMDYMESKNRT